MSRALIVGGGLIGLLTARELRARGHDVTLIERGDIGGEASWAGGGILSPLYPWRFPDAVTALTRRSLDLWPNLAATLRERTGIDPEYRTTGLLTIDADDPEEVCAWAERHGVSVNLLGREAAAALEPAAVLPPGNAFHMPAVGQVRNPRLLRALAALVVGEGVTLRTHVDVTAITTRGGRVAGLQTADGHEAGELVVLCAGAWTSHLLGDLGATPPAIEPVRGQMLIYDARPHLLGRILLAGGHYLIPRADGRIVVGSSIEHVGFEHGTTPEVQAELAVHAGRILPDLRTAPVLARWSGLRPGSPDGVPIIDRHPVVAGLWLNAGHFRNGIITAPASAELAADCIAGSPTRLDAAPYAWPAHG